MNATQTEKIVLQDIEDRTGMRFRRIGGIDTLKEEIAVPTLPILAEWVEKIDDLPHRMAIYSRFATPFAKPFLSSILDWKATEKDKLVSIYLLESLEAIAEPSNAERIWQACKHFPRRPSHFKLLAKLASISPVSREVRDVLVSALLDEDLNIGDLTYLASVEDVRIRQWFRERVNSQDTRVKALANRVFNKTRRLPQGVEYAKSSPDRRYEVFSTEEDLANLSRLLDTLSSRYQLKISANIKKGTFLASVDVDRWLVTSASKDHPGSGTLWFRLEDVDTVEVLLLGLQITQVPGPAILPN